MAKEVAMYGGDISEFLDPVIAKQVQEKYQALQEDRECK
jgi:phosphopantetheine adenylyltransferase